MKRAIFILSILLLSMVCVFAEPADSGEKQLTLTSQVPPGQGVKIPEGENFISIGDLTRGYLFYFLPHSSKHNIIENSKIVLTEETPDKQNSVTLNMHYSGNEDFSKSDAGKHTITIKAEPWKNNNDSSITNDVYVEAAGVNHEGTVSTTVVSGEKSDNASISVNIKSKGILEQFIVGDFTLSWDTKGLAAGPYSSVLTISIGAI